MDTALAAPAAALAGVLLGGLLTRSGEYRKWLRSERHRAAGELLAAGEALRRHGAGRVLAAYARGQGLDGPPGESEDAETHLADLERLSLALEAMRTIFPARLAVLAEEFADAAGKLAIPISAQPPEARPEGTPGDRMSPQPPEARPDGTPGDRYYEARAKLTTAGRGKIATSPWEQLWRMVTSIDRLGADK